MDEILPGVYLVDGTDDVARAQFGPTNICLLVDDDAVTLVDAGMPGRGGRVEAALAELGLPPAAVRRIIVTHHHIDHVGAVPELVALTGAEVWAHRDDADVIDGSVPRQPLSPELAQRALAALPPELREAAAKSFEEMVNVPPARVDLRLAGGEVLDVLGGVRILHTPGHTAGHLSLHLPGLKLLIAGDLLRLERGEIREAPRMMSAEPRRLLASALRMAELPVDAFVGYHGGYATSGAAGLLTAFAGRYAPRVQREPAGDAEGRYALYLGDEPAGGLGYRDEPAGRRVLIHTDVDPAFEGRGLGGKLAAAALDDARAAGLSVVPQCEFVAAYVERHPAYADLVA